MSTDALEGLAVEELAPDGAARRLCSRCGAEPPAAGADARVCATCGLGVYLECRDEAVASAFLVVDRDLRVTAVSVAAAAVLGDDRLVGAPVAEVISSPLGAELLGRALRRAAIGVPELCSLRAAAAGAHGALWVRISPCGPPRGALVALESAGP